MKIKFYNTASRKEEIFTPILSHKVSMYVCGPTVYDRAHLGNARSAVVFDVLYRFLSIHYDVTYVRNITDIDDKIIDASIKRGQSIAAITRETTEYYHTDMAKLGVKRPTIEPKATDHISEMIDMIKLLISQHKAYEEQGHVLFDTVSYPGYGGLSNRNMDEMLAGARVEVAPYKKNLQDFVLWKPSDENEPGWKSPWGVGRPGWHIECSAMTLKHLGKNFDIHGGGQDLIFPHHENERAQSECATKGGFANYWLHNGMLKVNGKKMSKSLGNIFTINELLRHYTGEEIRLAIISTHYRQPLDWKDNTLPMAKAVMRNFYRALDGDIAETDKIDQEVLEAIGADLNIPRAIARMHEIVSAIKKSKDSQERKGLRALLQNSGKVLGLFDAKNNRAESKISTEEVERLIASRMAAKKDKNYVLADQIRDDLKVMGIALEDNGETTNWYILNE